MNEIKLTNLSQVLEAYAQEAVTLYKTKLKRDDKLASGKLLNSVEYEMVIGGNHYMVYLTLEDYWKFVDIGVNGTEKNNDSPYSFKGPFVNYGAILNWVKIKPVLPRPRNGKLPTPEGLAWALSRSIAKKGIEGTHDLEETLTELNRKYETLIMDALDKDLAYAIDAEIQLLIRPS